MDLFDVLGIIWFSTAMTGLLIILISWFITLKRDDIRTKELYLLEKKRLEKELNDKES